MESEQKKRKRPETNSTSTFPPGRFRRPESTEVIMRRDRESLSPKPPTPSEDEVEEFFTIIRRMKLAVKTLQRSGSGKGKADCDGVKELTTTPLETDSNMVGDDIGVVRMRRSTTETNHHHQATAVVERNVNADSMSDGVRELDLNAEPSEMDS